MHACACMCVTDKDPGATREGGGKEWASRGRGQLELGAHGELT